MRKILIAVLLASATGPAFAAAPDRGDRKSDTRAERAEARAERAKARAERSEPRSESAEAPPAQPQVRAESSEQPRGERQRSAEPRRERGFVQNASAPPAQGSADAERPRVRDGSRERRASERQRADSPAAIQERNLRRGRTERPSGDLVEQQRPLPPVLDRDGRRRPISRTPVAGTEPPPPPTANRRIAEAARHWTTQWRRDRRYDWRDHRRRHRSRFHIGFYHDPFGWNYHRYGIGWRLWPSHYSSRYWLNDPWSYRLPPAYGPYRWVRYWDDALLVNIYTGEVVDVIHNFFW